MLIYCIQSTPNKTKEILFTSSYLSLPSNILLTACSNVVAGRSHSFCFYPPLQNITIINCYNSWLSERITDLWFEQQQQLLLLQPFSKLGANSQTYITTFCLYMCTCVCHHNNTITIMVVLRLACLAGCVYSHKLSFTSRPSPKGEDFSVQVCFLWLLSS